ncbi:hypothetical protein EB796_003043 [Bugula neritina]|uniref:Caspase family p10 domain-containing protein n=1 Tax=Bugula neritina TaxID=10212 RepID=A0A7J7KLE8_BUGNE|nr:hypothetical protein EB796_003043 [Bugula neritina]
MSVMLKDFKFDVMTHTDLKAETILSTIKDEVQQSADNLLVAESITETKGDVGDRDTASAPKAKPAQNKGAATGSQHPVGVPGDRKAEAMDILNYDDLLVVKSSMESFTSKRHPVYGSLMIRALVSSMYKHAGHHDLYTIFKQVQTKVRKLCVDRNLGSGQLVVAWDTLTHMRKLYLFPGFNGSKRDENS